MFVGAGTIINVLAIILGTTIGLFFGKRFKESTRELITQAMGFIVLIAAADAISQFWRSDFQSSFSNGVPILIILFALAAGGLLGSFLRIEDRLTHVGEALKRRFSQTSNDRFVEGFLAASILFVVGPMAILGSISDGMREGIELLVLKSTLDFFMTIAFTASYGWSVGLSVIPVALYQFAWTGIGFGLGEILNEIQVVALTVVGGTLLVGIALIGLGIKRIAVANLLPALILAPVATWILAIS
jgi:uncharacterized protein